MPERFPSTGQLHAPGGSAVLDCYPTNPRGYFDLDLRRPEDRERYARLPRLEAVARRAPFAVETRYNRAGFRDVEPDPPGERFRVVVVGDSFTEGQGVRQEDPFPQVLARALEAAEPGRWEVRNAGRRGRDLPGLVDVFHEALQYGPDIVLYAMVLNDADQSPEFHARQRYLNDWILERGRMLGGRPAATPGPLDSRLWSFVRDRMDARHVGDESIRWYRDMYGSPNADGWARTQEHVRGMDRVCRERGTRFALVLWPLLVDLRGSYPFAAQHETIAGFCRNARIPFRDLREALADVPTESLWVHAVDKHPNHIAHRKVGESLVPFVRTLAPPGRPSRVQ